MALFKIKETMSQLLLIRKMYVDYDTPSDMIVLVQKHTDVITPLLAEIMHNYTPWTHDMTRWFMMTLRKAGKLPKLRKKS
jgi:hypothetical protein